MTAAPLVSVLMVARNSAAFIDAAILSAREQSLTDIEIVVVDDGSSDGTAQLARAHTATDSRVRLLEGPQKGLSAVRNASLQAARGRFAAILDSDDILHPRHLEWLMARRARVGVEISVTNMIEFQEEGSSLTTRPFAQGPMWNEARQIGAEEYVGRGMIGGKGALPGYLKPLFDISFLRANGLGYDERLRIGEDFDLVLRAMLGGARYLYLPQATYYYRRHSASTSHRLSRADLEGLLRAAQAYPCEADGALAVELLARRANLEGALLHLDTIAAIKAGKLVRALRLTAGNRDARHLTLSSLYEATAKRIGRLQPSREDGLAASPMLGEPLAERLRAITQGLQSAVLNP
ncbi:MULTISPECIES: glycosyltransferase family 2 protein [unclassified Novosphingobium]|uniref:glycosyltransferase family 2 protein n=1 Tax=unclassified Novosphingobium TaxID=2644732 RepID=UPI0013579F95|nr:MULTISPECIES: glycosyltransferase family 2 protein [unclassified Novosphingobium]